MAQFLRICYMCIYPRLRQVTSLVGLARIYPEHANTIVHGHHHRTPIGCLWRKIRCLDTRRRRCDPMPPRSAATVCFAQDPMPRRSASPRASTPRSGKEHGNCMANGNRMANCMVCLACHARINDLLWCCGPDPGPFGICPRCATTESTTATAATASQLAPTTATTRQRRT